MILTDEDLVLFHFRDGLAPGEAERIERAIAADASLAARYRALAEDLAAFGPGADSPSAPAAAVHRWRQSLDCAAGSAPKVSPLRTLGLSAVPAAILAVSFGLALTLYRGGDPAAPAAPPAGADARFQRGLQWHLAEVESQLAVAAELPAAERGGVLDKLLRQNRLQTAAAEHAGESLDARLLRAFNGALEDLASGRALNGEFRGALAQLVFEVKVMQARLAASSPTASPRRLLAL